MIGCRTFRHIEISGRVRAYLALIKCRVGPRILPAPVVFQGSYNVTAQEKHRDHVTYAHNGHEYVAQVLYQLYRRKTRKEDRDHDQDFESNRKMLFLETNFTFDSHIE